MKLPETACISIKAPNPLPFEPDGFHWCEDVIFDNSTGTIDPDGGFKGSTLLITEGIVQKALVDACGYTPRDIMFFGMGQGGMLALNVAGRECSPSSRTSQALTITTSQLGRGVQRGRQYRWLTTSSSSSVAGSQVQDTCAGDMRSEQQLGYS